MSKRVFLSPPIPSRRREMSLTHSLTEEQKIKFHREEMRVSPVRFLSLHSSVERRRMLYGILLESARDGICLSYGQQIWKKIVEELQFQHESFTTLGRYEDNLIEKIAECNPSLLFSSLFVCIDFVVQVCPISFTREVPITTCSSSANASFDSSPTTVTTRSSEWLEDTLAISSIRSINCTIRRSSAFLE